MRISTGRQPANITSTQTPETREEQTLAKPAVQEQSQDSASVEKARHEKKSESDMGTVAIKLSLDQQLLELSPEMHGPESETSMNLQYLEFQFDMQNADRQNSELSKFMQSKSKTAHNSIKNVR
jgi:hypothetical protein